MKKRTLFIFVAVVGLLAGVEFFGRKLDEWCMTDTDEAGMGMDLALNAESRGGSSR